MKIGIIGANGNAGKLILAEAVKRKHEVTAIVRDRSKVAESVDVIEKDIFDLQTEELAAFDVVVDAFGEWQNVLLHQTTLKHLADQLSGHHHTRLLVVGSAGSLYIDEAKSSRVIDDPNMPAEFKALATSMAKAFDALKIRTDVNWTYASPATLFVVDAPLTNRFTIVSNDRLTFNENGENTIGYADFAVAVVDEIETGDFIGKRFSVIAD
ncbi:short chain dehydrogenase [Listeria grayi]|uniref:Short chain dehydrogenase n=1 Tax=Listeria grayi TaxID=1641 RepID=A0A378MG79_LISGR|nr:NAD(P)H-binding protein [Listeria grayi]STY45370.1 short chain dehydrogenase [Listeria grayi]